MSEYFKWDTGRAGDIGARVYNNADIAISTATNTTLTFNSERWDSDNLHSVSANTERLTCTQAGMYLIGCNVRWEANATGVRDVQLLLNGANVIARGYIDTSLAVAHTQNLNTVYDLAVGDYIEVRVYQNSGGNLNVLYATRYSPEFWMQRIST